MYCEEAALTGENVLPLLYCAKKYMVSGLREKCQRFLQDKLDQTNVCFLLEQVRMQQHE